METEKRLIDAKEAVIKMSRKITFLIQHGASPMQVYNRVLQVIAEALTVDAVEVVRCKDCKWRNTMGCPYMHFNAVAREDSDFCSDGERRSDGSA